MKVHDPPARLRRFWGAVDRRHVESILRHVRGRRVLDMGCGYGTTTAHLAAAGFECVGVDLDPGPLRVARARSPGDRYVRADAERLPFADATFETVVWRDALHHFFGEADFDRVVAEVRRVSRPGARFVVLDPNVNGVVRAARRVVAHVDEECDVETATRVLRERLGCRLVHASYHTVFSLPLSGGYVGPVLVPDVKALHRLLLGVERVAEAAVNAAGLGRHLCWRYLLAADRLD
ncbi:MAG: class I SAM-dependent methyltransferase [Planctomycetes bacterium]|nr:class I SAM-dependent methyltransferase [Planctomycetota bacterium]